MQDALRSLTVGGVLALCVLLGGGTALASPPATLHYQGYLTNAAGVPVSGTVPMVFRLYDAASAGALLWEESIPTVNVANGSFRVTLGTVVSLALPFNAPYWLGITAGTDEEMVPRQALAASAYAFRAMALDAAAPVAGSQVTGMIDSATVGGATLTQLNGLYAPNNATVQRRTVAPSCASGLVQSLAADGTPTCAPGGTTAFAAGPASVGNTLSFIGPTVQHVLSAPTNVLVTAHAALGSTALGGADYLHLYVCHQLAGGSLAQIGGGVFALRVAQNTRVPMGLSAVASLPAGTYSFGLCGRSPEAANWNSNEWGYVTAVRF